MFALPVGFVNVRVRGAAVLSCSWSLPHQDPTHQRPAEVFLGCSVTRPVAGHPSRSPGVEAGCA